MAESKNIFSSLGITPVQALLVGGGGFGIYKLLKKFGLIESEESKKESELLQVPYLSPRYLETLKGKKIMKWSNDTTPKEIAKFIKDSKGIFNDREDKLWGALKRITYKTQAATVSKWFTQMYALELTQYLSSFQSKEEMAKIFDYFEKLPSGVL